MARFPSSPSGFCRTIVTSVVIFLVVGAGARANPVLSGHEDHKLFGDLDQADTNCQANGCGPTAAVNSFVFLQNMYPDIYGDKLVPITRGQGGAPSQENMAAVANTLLGPNYMNTNCNCGTSIENFFKGKKKYIEDKVPGVTTYDFQSLLNNRPITAPTAEFIAQELEDGEDVEALIFDAGGNFSHYITLTDFTFDTRDDTGSLSYINPDGGAWESKDITGKAANGTITFNYSVDCPVCQITDVISESPIRVAEPPGVAAIVFPLLLLMWRRRRYRPIKRRPIQRADAGGGIEPLYAA